MPTIRTMTSKIMKRKTLLLLLLITLVCQGNEAFQSSRSLMRSNSNLVCAARKSADDDDDDAPSLSCLSRKAFVASLTTAAATLLTTTPSNAEDITVFKLPSGLKYLELEQGTGPTPQYGQLVIISYEAFIKLPASSDSKNPTPQRFDSSKAYVFKHGNGRLIAGLDEGVHSLQVGGKRRLLIPPKLGFVDIGLGPLPEHPWDRYRLNNLLDEMIAKSGGTLIYEIKLLNAMDDEADQGYYQDSSLTPEEFDTLRSNLQKKAAAAKAQQEQQQQT